MPRPLANFHPAVASWFENHLGAPTRIQERSWPVLSSGGHALISAPTGSGKTLAAFLSILNDLFVRALAGDLEPASKILYVSPLKALSNDVEKNLEAPLSGIADELRRNGITAPDVRVMVRTGDSTAAHRARMLRQKPHIIVTTPESLYVLLTSESGRNLLSTIETIIVDEVHAVVANRRGAHLALSMERLERVTGRRLQRIGISATVRPLQTVADFLAPGQDVTILHEGHHRETEIRMILPSTPLDAVMTMDAWADVNKQIAAMVQGIRTCLIFVNNRRLCERLSRQLSELLGDEYVGAHHGSLSYPQRLRAETALKDGRLKVMVATSSLELGIDVGSIDLVIQIASPRSIHAFLQRIGRSEHRHDGVSRAVLIPLTRDDLLECASVLYAMKSGGLEEISIPEAPLDVLAQQIVAEVSCGDVTSDELFTSITQSYPYRHLKRERFEEILGMLADGFTLRFGRRSRYVFYDRSRGTLQARKGARLSAITNGGAIPDNFEYEVILENEGAFLGTVHEDFAIESIAGDVFQLGNQFWRILRISTGKVMVAPAPGATPTMPFWIAEAPGRTVELSRAVSDLREELSHRLSLGLEGFTEFLETQAGLPAAAAAQVFEYLRETEKTLGTIPTQKRVVMERFFDEAGDCHIVIHSPYGARINRAWGLALRKRFCRKFNFELQAAASDDAVLFSLSKTHSFALSDVFSYVKRAAGEGLLKQAVLASPMFEIRWRWNASRSLAILRTYGGRRTPPQIQKSQAQDLVALVFPDQIACAENISGDRQIPNHPLVDQTMDDCRFSGRRAA
ncbi:MAG: DEAD/DEAH box helicase [Spirochaetia bacterium]|nr:DEAD/DEAH box helicase [Spirochaetia bacterium]